MANDTTLRARLGRRETWIQLAGAIGYFITLGLHIAGVLDPEQWEALAVAYAHALGLVGAGTVAQIKRGEQRAQAALASLNQGVSQATVKALIAQHVATTTHNPRQATPVVVPAATPPAAPLPPSATLTPAQLQAAHDAIAAHAAQPDAHHAAPTPPAAPPTEAAAAPPNAV